MKLGRNEKCWCASGLKYKRCHLDRDIQKPVSLSKVFEHSNNLSNREYCSVPDDLKVDCSGVIIQAHTVSKTGTLKAIADKTGHVLGLKAKLADLKRTNGKLRYERLGINKASIFKGFCSVHDKKLFSSFEDNSFISSEDQCFGLVYRSLAKEIYAKNGGLISNHFLKELDKGRTPTQQFEIQQFLKLYENGIRVAVKELEAFKSELDNKLLNKPYKRINHLILESSNVIPVAVSSMVSPIYDFKGKLIQNLDNTNIPSEHLIMNAFCSDGNSYVLFSWLEGCSIIDGFIQTFLEIKDNEKSDALLRFFFSSSENCFISPSWWDNLSNLQKNRINELAMYGASPITPVPNNVLSDNTIKFGGWNIEKIYQLPLNFN